MLLPNIIKLSQTVWVLWPAQDFDFRAYMYIMEKVKFSCMLYAYRFLPMLQANVIISFQNHKKVKDWQEFGSEI